MTIEQTLELKKEIPRNYVKAGSSRLIILATFLLSLFSIIPFYKSFTEVPSLYFMKYLTFAFFVLVLALQRREVKLDSISILAIYFITIFGAISFFNIESRAIPATALYLIIGISIALCTELFYKGIKPEVFNKMIWTILIAISAFVLVPSLEQSMLSSAYYVSTEGRFRFNGVFNNSNELARFCLLGLLISLRMLSIKKKRIVTMFLWFNIVASSYIIYLTNSRTSLIIAALGVIIYMFIHMFLRSKKLTLLLLYFIILILAIVLVSKAYSVFSVAGFQGINELLSGRLDSWKPVFNQNFTDILFGAGTVREGLASSVVLVNGYIEIIQYLGLVGLICWILFIGNMLIKKAIIIFKSPTKSQIQGLSIIILFMVYYLFEGGLVSIGNIASIYFWIELSQRGN
ncbi:hypothetical protein CN326_18270 [Bacillus sp. AFS018417]|uniref:O-antigen ligase family protein n=1 Tax=Bacillus sp. AFS018417 TaxID=2033491 RepID=UPI000BFA9CB9|nr:hypothetical protein [Bacillus sp. AFS018417]PEZ03464.1 hypothetical protein CN326_18270 [Bacillus sp. AFS018417]